MAVDHRDSGRLGKAVEHLVAATCILTSDLRLNVMTALADDEGVDLVFARRGEPKTLSVQVKSRRVSGMSMAKGTFRAQVRDSTFGVRPDLYLLFVAIDPAQGTFDLAWLVPSHELAEQDEARVKTILKDLGLDGAESIVLIDARSDNKPSASKAKRD